MGSVSRALWVEAQNEPVHPRLETQTAPCDLEVRVATTNGTRILFEEPSEDCTGGNTVEHDESTEDGLNYVMSLRGTLACMGELLTGFRLDPSCTTPWGYEGDHSTGDDDLTWAHVSAEITDQSECEMYEISGESSISLDVKMVGRMQVEVIGYVLPAKCKSNNAEMQCKDAAIAGATISGAVHPCESADACRDNLAAHGYNRLSCNLLVDLNIIGCADDAGSLVEDLAGTTVSDYCRQTCNTCPYSADATATVSGVVQDSRGSEGPLRQGAFEFAVPFSPSDAKSGASATVTIAKTNYKTVTLTVPLESGVVDVGNVYMPEVPPKSPAPISGMCIDYFVPSGEERGATFMTLENGIGWAGTTAVPAPDDVEQNLFRDGCDDPPCANVDNVFSYTQDNNQMGAKTATCPLGNSTSTQFVTSNGEQYATDTQPMLISNPSEGFVAVLSWFDANQPADFVAIADIEFYAKFGVQLDEDGSDNDASCELGGAFNNPECSGARYLQSGPFILPDTTPMVEVLAEAISLDQLYQTVYTFYARNRETPQALACSSESDESCTQIIDIAVELFGPSGKVLDVRSYSQSMGINTRLFCIDARVSPPVVHPALATSSIGEPPRCTECPC